MRSFRTLRHIAFPFVAACSALPVGALASAAQSPTPQRDITLEAAIATALRQNPDFLIAAAVMDSARAERRIASALPNPTLAGSPNTPYQYIASIPLDMTPQRYYRTRVAALGVSASAADRLDVARQTTLAVALAFFDALLAEQRLRLAMDRREAVQQVLQADSARVRSGDIPERNVTRSEVEVARADADVARANLDVATTRTSLQALMGVAHPDTAVRVAGSLDYKRLDISPDTLSAFALAHRPDLVASAQRVAQSQNAERSATALLFPTPVFSFVRQYTAPFESGHFYALGLAFELPILNLYTGQRRRAAAGLAASRFLQRRVEIKVDQDVSTAASAFRIQQALVERYQSGLLTKIDAAVTGAQYAYTHGATSLLDVLDAVRAQQDVRADYYTALHDYWVAAFALNAATGANVAGLIHP